MLKAPRARAVLERWERRRLLFWKAIALAGLSLSGWLLFHPPAHGASGPAPIGAEPSARPPGSRRHAQHGTAAEPVDFQARLAALRAASSQSARCMALSQLGTDDANEVVVAAIDAYAAADAAPVLRGCALAALARIPHPAASHCLAALLDEPDMSVLLQVVRALGLRSDAIAQDALRAAADTEDLELRAHIAAALSLHDPEAAIPIMMPLLMQVTGRSQLALIEALGLCKFAGAVKPLTRLIEQGHPQARSRAVWALVALGGKEASQALIGAFANAHSRELYTIGTALSQIDDPLARAALVAAAEGAHLERSLVALRALSNVDDARVQTLMRRAFRGADEGRASAATDYFIEHPDSSLLPELLELAQSGSSRRLQSVLTVIASIGGKESRAALVSLAREGSAAQGPALMMLSQDEGNTGELRALALEALRKGGQGGNVALSILAADSSPEARDALITMAKGQSANAGNAMFSLAQAGDAKAIEALEQIVARGRTPEDQQTALSALVSAGEARKLPLLMTALKSPSTRLREQALLGLSELGGPEAERAILAASSDADASVVHSALSSLGKLATPAALERLTNLARRGSDSVAQSALLQLSELDRERGGKLATQLAESDNQSARLAAVYAAGNLPRADAERIVLNAAKSNDPSLVEAALSQLSELPGDVAARTLSELLQNTQVPQDTRAQAAQALASFGGEVAEKHAALIEQLTAAPAGE